MSIVGCHPPWSFWKDMQTWSLGKQVKEMYFYSDKDILLDKDKLEELVEYRAANAESNITDPSPSKYFFKGMAHVTNIRNKDLFNEGVSELMDHHQALHSTPLPPPPQHQQQQQ
eukprot:m.74276 g.74276  ORF g.74276 m.74276 type:complete len:114 (-) comp11795_c0_seq2:860-1201(-)